MSENPIGSTWLNRTTSFQTLSCSHESYLGTRSKVEALQDGTVIETFQKCNMLLKQTIL